MFWTSGRSVAACKTAGSVAVAADAEKASLADPHERVGGRGSVINRREMERVNSERACGRRRIAVRSQRVGPVSCKLAGTSAALELCVIEEEAEAAPLLELTLARWTRCSR